MKTAGSLAFLLSLTLGLAPAHAGLFPRSHELQRLNRTLKGTIIDHTHRHGADRRVWSEALGEKRDLYIYLPPGYNPEKAYPIIIWLHGYAQDEYSFLEYVVRPLDHAMSSGHLAPAIVAAPDGSVSGRACLSSPGSFFLNTKAGRFEDFVMEDIWGFLHRNYAIRPEREAHILAGVSMGGGSAFNLGIKHRDQFKTVLGFFPPVNTRWMDCHGNYMANFDPNCWGWRSDIQKGHEVVGRFYGVVTIRLRRLLDPLYNRRDTAALSEIGRENPIELIDRLGLRDGELDMYVAYGGRDEFNIDAQVESFLFLARERGIQVSVGYEPRGRHDFSTAEKLLPAALDWLAIRLAPFSQ